MSTPPARAAASSSSRPGRTSVTKYSRARRSRSRRGSISAPRYGLKVRVRELPAHRVVRGARGAVAAQEPGVEAVVRGRLLPVVDVEPLDATAVAAREREHPLGRGVGAALAVREQRVPVRQDELHDPAGLGEPDLAPHRLQQPLRAAEALALALVRVAVVVEAPDARLLRGLLEDPQPALHVHLVDHVRRDDLAAAAVLAHHVVVLRRPLRVLERRLRAVVRLIPGADHLHLRPALAERLERLRVLPHRRQLARPARARRAKRRRRTRSAAPCRWPAPARATGRASRPRSGFRATFHEGK